MHQAAVSKQHGGDDVHLTTSLLWLTATCAGFTGGSFKFHDPADIFREFFGTTNPFAAFGGEEEEDGGMGGAGGLPGAFRMFSGGVGGMPGMAFGMGGMPGMAGMGGMGGMPGMAGMGGAGGPGGGASRRAAAGPVKGELIKRPLLCTLEELFNGCTKRVKITRQRLNPDGKTTRSDEKILELHVRPGWKKGTTLTFENEGDEAPGVVPADIQFIIGEKDHARFTRDGNDLVYECRLPLVDALTGTRLEVPTLDGRTLTVPVTEVAEPGSTKRIRGEGMPISKSPGSRGDLVVRFSVAFPPHLSEDKKREIRRVLG